MFEIRGFVDREGVVLNPEETERLFSADPLSAGRFGGEFFICSGEYRARDLLGVMPGDCPAGSVTFQGEVIGTVCPGPDDITKVPVDSPGKVQGPVASKTGSTGPGSSGPKGKHTGVAGKSSSDKVLPDERAGTGPGPDIPAGKETGESR